MPATDWQVNYYETCCSQPSPMPGRYYERRTPAMAIGLTDRRWSWREFLATKAPVSS